MPPCLPTMAMSPTRPGPMAAANRPGRWGIRKRCWISPSPPRHGPPVAAKQVVRRFYGHTALQSYFVGCSQGGHHALMEASRYPEDYDGIVAGAPGWEWMNLMAAELGNSQPYPHDATSIGSADVT